jgi:hypothetical protein
MKLRETKNHRARDKTKVGQMRLVFSLLAGKYNIVQGAS